MIGADAAARLVETLLGAPPCLSPGEVAEHLGVPVEDVLLFWHALGLPAADADSPVLSGRDATVLGHGLAAARRYEVEPRTGVSLVRSVGHSTERLVLWQVDAIVVHLSARYGLDDAAARLLALERLPDMDAVLEELVVDSYLR